VIAGLLLAVGCAVAGSVGVLLKQRGAMAAPVVLASHPVASAIGLFRSKWWTVGWLVALGAWLLHVGALSLASLSIVQAVISGGLVFLAIVAERFFGFHLGRRQWIGLLITAVGLTILGLTTAPTGRHYASGAALIAVEGAVVAVSGALFAVSSRLDTLHLRKGIVLGTAAGALFGVSDIAIKHLAHPVLSNVMMLVNPWTLSALIAMVVAFYASARSLQLGPAIAVITFMSLTGNVVALLGGIIVFHDPIGHAPPQIAARIAAFCLVIFGAALLPGRHRAGAATAADARAAVPTPARADLGRVVSEVNRRRRAQLGWRLAAALFSLALAGLIVLALSGIGFAGIGRSLSNVHPWWLVAALALNGFSMFLRAFSWQAVLRAALPEVRLRSLVVVRATMIGVLVSALVPGRFGEPARAYLVARRAGDAPRRFPLVLGTVFAQALINLVALAILAAITIASLSLIRDHSTALIAGVTVPIVVVALVVAGPALLARAKRSQHGHLSRIARWLSDQIVQVRRGLRVFTRPRLGAGAIVAQLAAWAVQTLAAFAVLYALNLQGKAGLAAAAAVLLAVNVTALVPVTPSNIGIFQAATIAVLVAYGVDAGHALAYGILLQAIEVTTAIVLGVPALLGERISLRDIRRYVAAPR
jgi:uncharacterized protein (TIRG00374 family)